MKLLICENDARMLGQLKERLDWERLGIKAIFTARDGMQAMHLLEQEQPQIMLCSAQLPDCEGLDLLKYCYDRELATNSILIGCGADFTYAQKAMQYGARNVLTMPMQWEMLWYLIKQIVGEIRRQTLGVPKDMPPVPQLNISFSSLRDGLYGSDLQKIDRALRRRKVPIAADSVWRQVYVSMDLTPALQNGWEKETVCYSARYLAQEVVAERMDFNYLVVDAGERYYNMTLFLPEELFSEEEIRQKCRKLCSLLERHTKIMPVCMIAEPVDLVKLPSKSQRQRRMMQRLRVWSGHVFLERECAADTFAEAAFTLHRETVMSAVRKGDAEEFLGQIRDCLMQITSANRGMERQMSLLHHDLLQCFYGLLQESQIRVYDLFTSDQMQEKNLYAERSVQDMMEFSRYLFENTAHIMHTGVNQGEIIDQIKQYIRDHYREDINREQIAEAVHITPNYLSKLFRSETGISLREYINQLRIERAKRMLLGTNRTVSEIASEVGFNNISYFSTIFHKYCHMSPVEYRVKQ